MNVVLNCSEVLEDHKAELAEQIARIIRELMSRTGLEIPTLKEIIVPDDFDAELLAYQEAHDIGERGRTNDEGGLAICNSDLAGDVNKEYMYIKETEKNKYLPKQVVDLMTIWWFYISLGACIYNVGSDDQTDTLNYLLTDISVGRLLDLSEELQA